MGKIERASVALLAAAVAVRMLASSGVSAAAARAFSGEFDAYTFAETALSIAAGVAPPPPPERADAPRVWVLHTLPKGTRPAEAPAEAAGEAPDEVPAEAPAPTIPPFTAAEAGGIKIGGACTYSVDRSALLTAPQVTFPAPAADGGPLVLITHTHTSEAYTQEAGWTYAETDNLRTTEEDYSVVRVGDELAAALEEKGIPVLHDTRLHDYPNYNGAYTRTLKDTQELLAAHPSIRAVLDVHRDATEDADGNPTGGTVTVAGESCARVMLVVGTDEGGLEHPNWRQNLSFALRAQAAAEREARGLCREIDLRTERFNQHVSAGAILVEVGSTGNTLREALAAARRFGGALGDLIRAGG